MRLDCPGCCRDLDPGAVVGFGPAKNDMTTFVLDLAWQIVMGASLMLLSRNSVTQEPLYRSMPLWSVIALNAMVYMPGGAYLLWRFPDWSYMYIFEGGELGIPDWWLVGAYPVVAISAVVGVRTLLLKEHLLGALGVLGGGLSLIGAVVFLGQRQLFSVGTTRDFRAGTITMQPLLESSLFWVLLAIFIPALSISIFAAWRLWLYGSTWVVEEIYEEVEELPEPTMPPAPTRKRRRSVT